MKSTQWIGRSIGLVGLLGSGSLSYGQIRAFPQAEGYGAVAMGARNGTPTVYHVTNLNATGAGSFVDAISVANRIIVFDVGGIINLSSAPSAKSNLYIAGQSAPGAGIMIAGYQGFGFASTGNNIARYLRLRPGSQSPGSDNCIGMGRTSSAILDHMSLEFGKYNNIDAVSVTGDNPRVTIQNSIIADPISNGTSNRGQGFGAHLEASTGYFTLTKNLWVSGHSREPLAKVNDQFINNIEYNNEVGYLTSGTSGVFNHDLVNNAFIFGPASTSSADFGQLSTPDTFYSSGNVQDTDKNGTFNPTSTNPSTVNPLSGTPLHSTTTSLPTLSVNDAYNYVLAKSGASLSRDDLDTLVVSQVQTLGLGTAGYTAGTTGPAVTDVPLDVESPFAGHTGLYHKSSDTGLANNGLGTVATSSRPAGFDTDNDGVADTWEATHGMSSSVATDNVLLNPLGYTMIEQYLNELGDTATVRTYSAPSGAWSATASWGGTLPNAVENAKVTGNGTSNGSATVTTSTYSMMKLDIGGNGPLTTTGEVVNVTSGKLDVYDTITVGLNNNATLNVSGGTCEAWNIQLGNTAYSPTATNYTGTINLSGGTLGVSSLVRGVGVPGNWSTGGSVNITGGTIQAIGTLFINVPMAFNGNATINTNSFSGSINGNMTGASTLTKTGAGTLTLTGNNSGFSGPITLSTGTLQLNMNSSNSPTGLITMANGTGVNVQTSGANTPIAPASGATATLTGLGGLTYGGVITGPSNSTILVVGSSTGTSNFTIGGNLSGFAGTLDFTNANTIRMSLSTGTGSASAKFVMGSGTALIRSAFGTTVSMGSLTGGATTSLQGATNDAVNTTFSIGALNTSTTYSGLIANGTFTTVGTSSVTKVGTGTLTLDNAASTYTGVTTVSGGTLAVSTLANGGVNSSIGASTNAATNLVLDGGTLKYTGAAASTNRILSLTQNGGALDASGTGALSFPTSTSITQVGTGNRTLTLTGTNTGLNVFALGLPDPSTGIASLTKSGAGTWALVGAKTYSGPTNITAGILALASASTLPNGAGKGDVNISAGATAELYGMSHSINGLNGAGTVTVTNGTASTLTMGNGDASGNFTGTFTQGGTQTLNLAKVGTGTQILNGTYNYTGTTVVAGGTLQTVKALQNRTAMSINSNAKVEIPSNGSSTAVTKIKSLSIPITGVNFLGTLQLHNNDLVIDYTGSSTPYGSALNMLKSGLTLLGGDGTGIASSEVDAQTLQGTMLALVDNGTIGGQITSLSGYNGVTASSVLVKYTWFGDCNLDGTVDGSDYALIDSGFTSGGSLTGWVFGDYDYNGAVDGSDYALIDTGFISQAGVLPEPTMLGLLGIGAISFLRRRRNV